MIMRSEIALGVASVASKTYIESCNPNKSVLQEALSFDVATLEDTSEVLLSKYILVLGQYLVFLKYQENEIRVQYMEADKQLNRDIASKIKAVSWKTNVPLKEKTLLVADGDSALQQLMLERDVLEAQLTILDGMGSAFTEYLNAYKREASRRIGALSA